MGTVSPAAKMTLFVLVALLSCMLGGVALSSTLPLPSPLGSFELRVIHVEESDPRLYERTLERPFLPLIENLTLASIEALIEIRDGSEGEDQADTGDHCSPVLDIQILLPDGYSCWLSSRVAESSYVGHRPSTVRGDIYECTTIMARAGSDDCSAGSSLKFTCEDLMAAFRYMQEKTHRSFSPAEAQVIGIHPLPSVLLSGGGHTYLTVKPFGLLNWIGCTLSSLRIDGVELPVKGGVADIRGLSGVHVVVAEAGGRLFFIPVSRSESFTVSLGDPHCG